MIKRENKKKSKKTDKEMKIPKKKPLKKDEIINILKDELVRKDKEIEKLKEENKLLLNVTYKKVKQKLENAND